MSAVNDPFRSCSLHGNDPHVKFQIYNVHNTSHRQILLRKYCCDPLFYDEYRTCFRCEFEKMQDVQRNMQKIGHAKTYSQLFPAYHRFGSAKDHAPYLEMDFIQGITLEKFLTSSAPLSPAQILRLFSQIDLAQHCLAMAGLFQTDLSPQNMIVTDSLSMKIMFIDFTDAYYSDPSIRAARSMVGHYHHLIDGQASPGISPARQLEEAAALLFTRLFYKGQEDYLRYRSADPFFQKNGYAQLLHCLLKKVPDPDSADDSLTYWDDWISLLRDILRA